MNRRRARFVVALLLLPLTTAAHAAAIGTATLTLPATTGGPVEVAIWYPAAVSGPAVPVEGAHLPLVAIAHGQGGDPSNHADLARALAAAGFVVAAPRFAGDDDRDLSRALDIEGRDRTFIAVIHAMVAAWHPGAIDPDRIGAFGFSAGGLTVLLAAGGVPDLGRVAPYCRAEPASAVCRTIAAHAAGAQTLAAPAGGFPHDSGIRAIVLAAPALGFAFTRPGLATVTIPVQLWRAGDDTVLPAPTAADAVRAALPRPAEFHLVPGARHVDFVAPCDPATAGAASGVCGSGAGFDRAAFHVTFDRAVVSFFRRALRPR